MELATSAISAPGERSFKRVAGTKLTFTGELVVINNHIFYSSNWMKPLLRQNISIFGKKLRNHCQITFERWYKTLRLGAYLATERRHSFTLSVPISIVGENPVPTNVPGKLS